MSKSTESFESIKSDIISFLKDIEKKENSNELKKAINYFSNSEILVNHLEKSETGDWIEKAGYGVGTIRIWKGKKYKKISASPVRWVRVFDKVDRGAKNAMTRLIHKAESIDSPEEMMKFLLENKQRFYNEDQKRYTDLVDRLNAFVDSKEYKQNSKGNTISLDEIQNYKAPSKIEGLVDGGNFKAEIKGSSLKINDLNGNMKRIYKNITPFKSMQPSMKFKLHKLEQAGKLSPGDRANVFESNGKYYLLKKGKGLQDIDGYKYANTDSVICLSDNSKKEEKNTYWVQDSKGNRLTNEDAKKRIKSNFKKIDSIKNKMDSMDNKADKKHAELEIKNLQYDNKTLMDYLDANDRSEMKAESTLHYNSDVKAPSEESEKNRQERVNQNKKDKDFESENKTKKFDVDSIKGQEGPVTMFKNQMETWNKEKLTDYYNEKLDKIKNNKVSGAAIQNVKNQFVAAKELLNEKFGNDNKESKSKTAAKNTLKNMLNNIKKEFESEAEKHQNRSDAMKGNKNAWKGLSKEEQDKKKSDYTIELVDKTDRYTSKDYENLKQQVLDGKTGLIGGGDDIPKEERADIISKLAESVKKGEKEESKKESPTITFDRNGKIGQKAVNYSAIKSVPTDSPSGPKEALEKATVEDYDYNSTTKGKMVTIPGSKEVLDAFKRLDSIVDHGVHWKSNQIFTRQFGIQDGYLYTTDGRQAKRVKIDGLDGLPERGMYDAKIENGNLVLKEQPNIGTFPLVGKVIPQNNDKSLRLDNKTLKDKIKELKATKYFTKDSPFIDLKIKNGNIMIGNTQIGKTENYSGDDFNIRMNNEFLLNSLSKGDSSILNFAEDFTTDEKGNKYAIKAMGISENTGDNIMMPSQPYRELADPDEHLKETSERNSNLKNAAINSITSELNNDRFKDVDQKLKDRAIKFMGNHESKDILKDVYSLTQALPFIHKILNEKQFIDMGLKPEFGKTDGSKYVRFRDKNGEPTGSYVFDNPVVAKFFKELAKDGAFGEMKKSELRDTTSLESYVKKSISILKKSLIG